VLEDYPPIKDMKLQATGLHKSQIGRATSTAGKRERASGLYDDPQKPDFFAKIPCRQVIKQRTAIGAERGDEKTGLILRPRQRQGEPKNMAKYLSVNENQRRKNYGRAEDKGKARMTY